MKLSNLYTSNCKNWIVNYLAFRILVYVPQVWLFLKHASSLLHLPYVHPFFQYSKFYPKELSTFKSCEKYYPEELSKINFIQKLMWLIQHEFIKQSSRTKLLLSVFIISVVFACFPVINGQPLFIWRNNGPKK